MYQVEAQLSLFSSRYFSIASTLFESPCSTSTPNLFALAVTTLFVSVLVITTVIPNFLSQFMANPSFLFAATNSSPSWFNQTRSSLKHPSKSVKIILGNACAFSFFFITDDYSISTISSISTDAFKGSTAIPTADLACFPASPNISNSNSLAPFITAGC